jgi:hypothetical protein
MRFISFTNDLNGNEFKKVIYYFHCPVYYINKIDYTPCSSTGTDMTDLRG